MTINEILSLALACCGLFAAGVYVEAWMCPNDEHPDSVLGDLEDEDLFAGWDWLTPAARRYRLALYHQRVRARIAEQERAWLQARLKEAAETKSPARGGAFY